MGKINPKEVLSVWLDVSSKKIDVCFWIESWDIYLQVKNNSEDLMKFTKQMKKLWIKTSIPMVIESTWDLHILAALILTDCWFTVKEINPIITKHYINHNVRGTKTDKTDSKALAKIWIVEWNQLQTFNRPKKFIELWKKISLISSLEKQIHSIKASINSYKKTSENLSMDVWETVKDLGTLVKKFGEQIDKLKKEIEDYEFDDPKSKEIIERLDSITWITKYTATVCFISFAHKKFVSKEAMFAFIWYDPKLKQSWDKNVWVRISKRWNSYVRKKLFQSAFCSIQHCKLFKKIYTSMIEKWKHHFKAVICIIKKMIHIMRSMIKYKTYFNQSVA